MHAFDQLDAHVAQINDLLNIVNLLNWDTSTQMPPGGAVTRGQQLSTLIRVVNEKFVSAETARLLDAAEAATNASTPELQSRAVRELRRCHALALRVPTALLAGMAERRPVIEAAWAEARKQNKFALFQPHLERVWEDQRALAEAIGYSEHPYDALLSKYEPDMRKSQVLDMMTALRSGLLPLLREAMTKGDVIRTDFLHRDYDIAQQRAFGLAMAQKLGYDLNRGRLDISAHPFEVSFTRNDVRITTRYKQDFLPQALFGVLHETGHALYEQGIAPALTRSVHTTDLIGAYAVGGSSFGAHESQSRLWENMIGRSRAFWRVHFAQLQAQFPTQLADVDAEQFYRGVNHVHPGYIRVEADELTYNFHIMLRVEIEAALLDGSLKVAELPEAWRAKMQDYLGVQPPTDTLGVLQDVHWAMGSIGSFCTYAVGNVMSGQFMAAARRALPTLDGQLAAGTYDGLRAWLSENIYQHGRAYTPHELLMRSTGEGLNPAPYLAYLHTKYAAIYGV